MGEVISPFEWSARTYAKCGMPIDEARDTVIMRCLNAGDASAFSYFVLAGHQPGAEVMRAIAFMTAERVPAQIEAVLPYGLASKRRSPGKAGKRSDPLIEMRDDLFALNVEAEFAAPGQYDAAISTVHERVEQAVREKTIRNAYDGMASKGKK